MDYFLLVVSIILMLAGLVGCVIPMIPGPPLCFVALLLTLSFENVPLSWSQIIIWAIVVVIITLVDSFLPAWGTKKFGGSKTGMWGSVIGLFIGLSFLPFGLIVGPFVGAFIGEKIEGKNGNEALRAGVGSFLGLVAGTILKLVVCVTLCVDYVKNVIVFFS